MYYNQNNRVFFYGIFLFCNTKPARNQFDHNVISNLHHNNKRASAFLHVYVYDFLYVTSIEYVVFDP